MTIMTLKEPIAEVVQWNFFFLKLPQEKSKVYLKKTNFAIFQQVQYISLYAPGNANNK